MHEEGLKFEDVFHIIAQLNPEHYQWGPEDDRDGSSGSVVLFFYPYGEFTLYIKLKIWTDEHGDAGAVLSFHEEGIHD